ncbi:hypothetical protein QQX98_000339 [Neonectria punicea]|uniref:Uncharacterized protein n=1 Tax=Neonectria punicea TaxID=979145 RepID=A0ABR1HVW3_9HYPO
MASKAALQLLQDELKDTVFRDVDGFLIKYFEGQCWWSTAVQKTLHHPESAVIRKLSMDLFNLAHSDALAEWLATFQSLFLTPDHPSLRISHHRHRA